MGDPAQSVVSIYEVSGFNELWREICPMMRDVDAEFWGEHAIHLDLGETGISIPYYQGVYLDRGGILRTALSEYTKNKGACAISIEQAMEILNCTRHQFFERVQTAVLGHLRNAHERALEKAKRLANASVTVAKLRFVDKPK